MVTMILNGRLVAETPIMITRPDSNGRFMTMVTMVEGRPCRVPAVPGESIKGMFRAAGYRIAVDNARRQNPGVTCTLDKFYEQTLGGLEFRAKDAVLGSQDALRARQPILSLFGSATPKVTGRLIVEPAISKVSVEDLPKGGKKDSAGTGMIGGTRRDPLLVDSEMGELLKEGDRARWAKMAEIIQETSKLRAQSKAEERAVMDLKEQIADMEAGPDKDALKEKLAEAEAKYKQAETALAKMKTTDDYKNAIHRPLDPRSAIPAGTEFSHRIELRAGTEVEAGLLLRILAAWNDDPRIGGGRTTGYGRVSGEYSVTLLEKGEAGATERRHIGRVVVGGDGAELFQSDAQDFERLLSAWDLAATDILQRFDIFNAPAA